MKLPIFQTVLNGITVVGSIVGTRVDLKEVFELHAAGRTHVTYEERPLVEVNEAIDDVLDGNVPARVVFDRNSRYHGWRTRSRSIVAAFATRACTYSRTSPPRSSARLPPGGCTRASRRRPVVRMSTAARFSGTSTVRSSASRTSSTATRSPGATSALARTCLFSPTRHTPGSAA